MTVYDPTDEFQATVDWPDVDPIKRQLSSEEWGIYGEGLEHDWGNFTQMLNEGRLGSQPAKLQPDAPEGWGETMLPMARSKQKPRGKHLFAIVGATPGTVLRAQGQAGATEYGNNPREFATNLEKKVYDYADRFSTGETPGRFHVWLTPEGEVQGPQEGRHRAAAAMLAGLDWVPVVVLWESHPFRRPMGAIEGTDGYRANYPGE